MGCGESLARRGQKGRGRRRGCRRIDTAKKLGRDGGKERRALWAGPQRSKKTPTPISREQTKTWRRPGVESQRATQPATEKWRKQMFGCNTMRPDQDRICFLDAAFFFLFSVFRNRYFLISVSLQFFTISVGSSATKTREAESKYERLKLNSIKI